MTREDSILLPPNGWWQRRKELAPLKDFSFGFYLLSN